MVHLRAQDRALVEEKARTVCVASRLREEYRHGIPLRHLVQRLISRDFEGVGGIAPFVGVEAEEVDCLVCVVAAGQIVLEHRAQFGNICGGIAHRDLAETLAVAVGFHVAGGGFDEWGDFGLVCAGNNLIADKHTESIRVVGKCIKISCEGFVLAVGPDCSLLLRRLVCDTWQSIRELPGGPLEMLCY